MIATQAANKILNKILKGTDYTAPSGLVISLHTADPGDSGTNEVSGGSYARQTPTLGTVADKACTNTAAITWTDMPDCTVTYAGLWDGDGALWMYGAFTTPKVVLTGGTLTVDAGDCDFSIT